MRTERWLKKRPPEEPLDYSPSSGAVDSFQKEYDVAAPRSHDGRALTRTKFYPSESSDNSEINYTRLAKLNDGMYSEKRDDRKREAQRLRDLDAFCSTLNITQTDKERCLYLHNQVEDIRRHETDEVLLLAIITLVANENERMIRQEDMFNDICESCSVTRSQIRNSRDKLRDKL